MGHGLPGVAAGLADGLAAGQGQRRLAGAGRAGGVAAAPAATGAVASGAGVGDRQWRQYGRAALVSAALEPPGGLRGGQRPVAGGAGAGASQLPASQSIAPAPRERLDAGGAG